MVVGALGYVTLVLFLRLSGNRTLSRMTAFDLVVTVALGSTLATMLLSSEVSLTEGVLALALLIALQYSIGWLSVRSRQFRQIISSEPVLILHRSRTLHDAMTAQRVTEEDLLTALRAAGLASPEQAESVVLEADGSFSVIKAGAQRQSGAFLEGLERPRRRERERRAA